MCGCLTVIHSAKTQDSLENTVTSVLSNRCVMGNSVAGTPLTNWGLSGIAGKRKQHLGPLSSCHRDVGGVVPETGVLGSGFIVFDVGVSQTQQMLTRNHMFLFHNIDLTMRRRVIELIQSRADSAVKQSTMNSDSFGSLCADIHLVCVPDGRCETKKNGLLLCFKSFPAARIAPVRIRINFLCSACVCRLPPNLSHTNCLATKALKTEQEV